MKCVLFYLSIVLVFRPLTSINSIKSCTTRKPNQNVVFIVQSSSFNNFQKYFMRLDTCIHTWIQLQIFSERMVLILETVVQTVMFQLPQNTFCAMSMSLLHVEKYTWQSAPDIRLIYIYTLLSTIWLFHKLLSEISFVTYFSLN